MEVVESYGKDATGTNCFNADFCRSRVCTLYRPVAAVRLKERRDRAELETMDSGAVEKVQEQRFEIAARFFESIAIT